jgi:hypothetical protein
MGRGSVDINCDPRCRQAHMAGLARLHPKCVRRRASRLATAWGRHAIDRRDPQQQCILAVRHVVPFVGWKIS